VLLVARERLLFLTSRFWSVIVTQQSPNLKRELERDQLLRYSVVSLTAMTSLEPDWMCFADIFVELQVM
jgi:hypothetical protein